MMLVDALAAAGDWGLMSTRSVLNPCRYVVNFLSATFSTCVSFKPWQSGTTHSEIKLKVKSENKLERKGKGNMLVVCVNLLTPGLLVPKEEGWGAL